MRILIARADSHQLSNISQMLPEFTHLGATEIEALQYCIEARARVLWFDNLPNV